MLCGSLRLITRLPANPSVHASVCVCDTHCTNGCSAVVSAAAEANLCSFYARFCFTRNISEASLSANFDRRPAKRGTGSEKSPIRRPDDDKEPGFPVTNHPLSFLSFLWAVNGGDDGQIAQLSHWICVGGR